MSWRCRRACRRRSASWSAPRRKGCSPLSVGVGLSVLAELMEEEVVEVVGSKGKHDRLAPLCATATSRVRSRSAADASGSSGHGCRAVDG